MILFWRLGLVILAKKILETFVFIDLFVSLHPQTKSIGLWCNGNTTDSGPVIPGSNPGSPTYWFLTIKAR